MRVFLAGATGAIGRRVIPQLLAAGHTVTALLRSPRPPQEGTGSHVMWVVGDALDRDRILRLIQEDRPEAIVSQLTALPDHLNPRHLTTYYALNNRIRREGNANLLDAALSVGVGRFILQSAGYWYAPEGSELKDEDATFGLTASDPIGSAIQTMADVEEAVLDAPGIAGVALRYGTLYGPGTWYDHEGDVSRRMRRRSYPIIGNGEYVTSLLHVDDAASAAVAVVTTGTGPYNVADDDPAAASVWMPIYAKALGTRPPLHVPVFVARLAGGRALTDWILSQRGISNAKIKQEIVWQPTYPTWRDGFFEALGGR